MTERIVNSFVIPAYNEQHRISPTLDYVLHYTRDRNLPAEIMVVDDGSTDKTCRIVEGYASRNSCVWLLATHGHRGKGAAVRTGLLAAQGEMIYLCDADL